MFGHGGDAAGDVESVYVLYACLCLMSELVQGAELLDQAAQSAMAAMLQMRLCFDTWILGCVCLCAEQRQVC